MKNEEIEFNADDLISAVSDVRDHVTKKRKVTMRTTKVTLPKKPAQMTPSQIVALRRDLNVSQPVFAQMINVSVDTAAGWEKGRRRPSGPALRVLQIAKQHPETLLGKPIKRKRPVAKVS